jgi:uncharacterized protein HemX
LASTRAATVAAPARRPRPKTEPKATPKAAPKPAPRRPSARTRRRAHSRAAIAWIVVFGVLLAGVVFVNLAVLQLNLRLDSATHQRTTLKAENAALVAQLSAALASPRIQKLAHSQDGLVQADPSSIDYIDLGK